MLIARTEKEKEIEEKETEGSPNRAFVVWRVSLTILAS
jgi:hypothetical protein